jgi:hypothetical protein
LSILCIDGQRVSVNRPLQVGDVVKVSLPVRGKGQVTTEAPWAEVVELMPNNSWLGRIANPLIYNHGFDLGDCVVFEKNDDDTGWWWEVVASDDVPKAN